MSTRLRHPQLGPLRAEPRKAAPRGASRPVVREPLRARLPAVDLSGVKRLLGPLLWVAMGLALFELGNRIFPHFDQPIAQVGVQGEISRAHRDEVQARIDPFVTESFFNVDLDGLRVSLESMPWIARAEVRRVWPDTIMISLEEQMPIARWGSAALLNNRGEAFAPNAGGYEHLPWLNGPERAREQVMHQYQLLSQMLRPLGFSIAGLEMRERGSWFLVTAPDAQGNSIEMLLGRDHQLEKIRRLGVVFEKALKPQVDNIARIDLRYANGLAVAWRDPQAAQISAPLQQN